MNVSDKKTLITGAHGFLGSHLMENLFKKRNVPEENVFTPTSKEYDLRDWESCKKVVRGKELIIHLAGKVGGIGFNQEKPAELFYDNIVMGAQIMEAARQAGVAKFVTLGTICSYPKFTPVPFKEEDIWNGYPEETNAPYGLAKKMLLVQAQAYRKQYGFNAVVLFPVNMYGPHDSFDLRHSHVLPALIRKVYEAKKSGRDYVEVWGTGKPTREFLYVEDAAEAILLATEKYDKSEPVNIGSGMEISIKDLVTSVCKMLNYSGEIRWDTSRPDGQPRRLLDVSRAKHEFGFVAKTSFEDGLKRTIEWYLRSTSEQS